MKDYKDYNALTNNQAALPAGLFNELGELREYGFYTVLYRK
jgi:hypothetical protein